MNDTDFMRTQILNIMKEIGVFTFDELKIELCNIEGDIDLIIDIAEHLMLYYPQLDNCYGTFYMKQWRL